MLPLLSIIIPTKDRYKYLKQLICLIDSFKLERLELVLQDNTRDNSEIVDFLNDKERTFLKYFHIKESMPISNNVDLAIENSTGEYVCFIGDDDGILPNIVECVEWMKKNEIEALRPAVAIFNWPDYIDWDNEGLSGALLFDEFSFEMSEINSKSSLQALAQRGFRNIYTIPKLYQGIVKRSCLNEIYKIGKTYTPGPSPDMATAVALCFTVKKFVTINVPVILVGQCHSVGGGERTLKGMTKDIDDVPFLPKNSKIAWDERIPRVWCSQTVWPESAIKALAYMGKKNEIEINYEFILAWFVQTHPLDKRLAISLSKNKILLHFYLTYYLLNTPLNKLNSLFRSEKKLEGRKILVSEIENIQQASDYFLKYYASYTNKQVFNDNF